MGVVERYAWCWHAQRVDSRADLPQRVLVKLLRLVFSTLGVLGSLLATKAAHAELTWRAPAECSREAFVSKLERATEQPLNALPGVIELEIQVDASARWVARFHLVDDMGDKSAQRELRGSSCADVANAAAVAVAMALHDENEPTLSNEKASGTAGTETRTAAATAPTADARETPSPEPGGPAPELGLHAQLLVDTSLFGEAALAAGIGVSVYSGSLGLEAEGAALLPKELRVSDTLGVELLGGLASATGCYRAASVATEPRMCLGYQGAYINARGTGRGLKLSRNQSALWHALHARGSMGTALSENFALRLFIAPRLR